MVISEQRHISRQLPRIGVGQNGGSIPDMNNGGRQLDIARRSDRGTVHMIGTNGNRPGRDHVSGDDDHACGSVDQQISPWKNQILNFDFGAVRTNDQQLKIAPCGQLFARGRGVPIAREGVAVSAPFEIGSVRADCDPFIVRPADVQCERLGNGIDLARRRHSQQQSFFQRLHFRERSPRPRFHPSSRL